MATLEELLNEQVKYTPENKNKDKNPTINQCKNNTSTNGIHVKNSNCDKNSNSEDNNSSNICATIHDKNNTYLKKIKDTEEKKD
jgi:hypothetical protein